MDEVLGVIAHNALGVITAGALTAFGAVLRSLWKHMQATQNGVQCMLRSQIIDIYNLTKAYKAYLGLDGNGVIPGLYKTVMDMPTEPEEEAEEG